MFCNNCGNTLTEADRFCPVCGAPAGVQAAPVDEDRTIMINPNSQEAPMTPDQYFAQQPTPQPAPQPQPMPQQYAQPQAQYTQPQAQYAQPQQQYAQQQYAQPQQTVSPAVASLSKSCLIFGIVGLALSCGFYTSLFGIIFSAVGLSKCSALQKYMNPLTGKAKVGHGLALGGLISGIVFFVLFIIWVCAVACVACFA